MAITVMLFCVAPVLACLCFLLVVRLKSKCGGFIIVVMGDVGRSPRMQYHSISLAENGIPVTLMGFRGSELPKTITDNPLIKVSYIPNMINVMIPLPMIAKYIFKTIAQTSQLFIVLLASSFNSKCLMIQNPPSIPTMAVVWFISRLTNAKFIIDWHNLGHTILALATGPKHPLVKLATYYEYLFGRFADTNFCVTNALKCYLSERGIKAHVLHDRPASIFRETKIDEKHSLFQKLSKDYNVFASEKETSTVFTKKSSCGTIRAKRSRPVLLVSSTSWTEDEDFSILLRALEIYDDKFDELSKVSKMPSIVCVITGKGPQKEYYLKEIDKRSLRHTKFCTPWLSPADYPLLLGSADLGVCLHYSSSGLDLPMKVVDMFGACLPVCAINFRCLQELVTEGQNGVLFNNAEDLAEQLFCLLHNFPDETFTLNRLKSNLRANSWSGWKEQWNDIALPVIKIDLL